jgi:hypothetical protein
MEELTKYVFKNYTYLMTWHEKAAYKSVMGEMKAKNAESCELANLLQRRMVSSDPQVLALLKQGTDAFYQAVRDRILCECADKVFLNHCPKCGALARGPKSKQCPKCFFSWHFAA